MQHSKWWVTIPAETNNPFFSSRTFIITIDSPVPLKDHLDAVKERHDVDRILSLKRHSVSWK